MNRIIQVMLAIIILLTAYHSDRAFVVSDSHDLADLQLDKVAVQTSNIVLALSNITGEYKVPIGLEVSPEDDLLKDRDIRVQMENPTLRTVLNSIVTQNPLYTWEVSEGVINVFPRGDREPPLKAVLETKLRDFRVAEKMARFTFREAVTQNAEVQRTLAAFAILTRNEIFTSYDVGLLGRGFSLAVSNVTVKSMLNRVILESDTKFWMVNLDGPSRRYLLLNL